jgi:non-canonical purine NTP pyrophosphatase (RdgB/HAM1 family)
MALKFITGNKGKYAEASEIIPDLEQINLDLVEIQDLDPKAIIEAKLNEALGKETGEFIVEDTSLYLDCLKGLPGPLIKWFMKTIGFQGLYDIARKFGIYGAEAKVIIGYTSKNKKIRFFEGTLRGEIVAPAGPDDFGWDPIFKPEGYDKTFAQMDRNEKNAISMRRIAFNMLKDYLASPDRQE